MCQLVQQPKQDYQLVNIAYIVFQKVPIFHESLIRRNKTTEIKTYNDFKIHMRQECNELAKVGGLTVESSNLNGINLFNKIQEIKITLN